jgi:hypothetical protein
VRASTDLSGLREAVSFERWGQIPSMADSFRERTFCGERPVARYQWAALFTLPDLAIKHFSLFSWQPLKA